MVYFRCVGPAKPTPRQCARRQLRMQQGPWTRHTFEGDSPHRGAPCATSLIFCGFSLGAIDPLQLTLPKRKGPSWHVPNLLFFSSMGNWQLGPFLIKEKGPAGMSPIYFFFPPWAIGSWALFLWAMSIAEEPKKPQLIKVFLGFCYFLCRYLSAFSFAFLCKPHSHIGNLRYLQL